MKYARYASILTGVLLSLQAASGQADNKAVNDALQSRPELSEFYQGLVSTGVIHELKENTEYTVFAPTNEAFVKFPQNLYPCLYDPSCKQQAAEILRNHIVPGEKHLRDMGARQDVAMSLFAIDGRHLVASADGHDRDDFTIDGHRVVSENQLLGGMLYKIDGLIATPREMAQFMGPQVVYMPGTDLPPRSPEGSVITVTHYDQAY